jgi:hypothetical protein
MALPPVPLNSEISDRSGLASRIWADWFLKAYAVMTGTLSGLTGLTGDVTATGPGSAPATIGANVVNNAKLAQMAANSIKGNNTGGVANASDLTATQTTAMLNAVVGDSGSGGTKGLVPAPSSGDGSAGKYLRADATWALDDTRSVNGFRLSLTSGTPVTTADVTGATTIYCTPLKSNLIALYDGSKWNLRASSEFSLALGTLTSGKPYDVFCYDNSGVPTLEFLVWTNDTTRATALAQQDGVYVKSGAATRRYLGTFYTKSATTTEDSAQFRYLYNFYHQFQKPLLRQESTASWNYTTATIRQANGSTSNQVEVMNGLDINLVDLTLNAIVGSGSAPDLVTAIGLDSTSTVVSANVGGGGNLNNVTLSRTACYRGFVGVGRHYLAWLESSSATGTTTWYGSYTGAGGTVKSGLSGSWLC